MIPAYTGRPLRFLPAGTCAPPRRVRSARWRAQIPDQSSGISAVARASPSGGTCSPKPPRSRGLAAAILMILRGCCTSQMDPMRIVLVGGLVLLRQLRLGGAPRLRLGADGGDTRGEGDHGRAAEEAERLNHGATVHPPKPRPRPQSAHARLFRRGTDIHAPYLSHRYRMRWSLFSNSVAMCKDNTCYFKRKRNATGLMGFSAHQKKSAVMRIFA
jgi:hypothetical protein